MVLFLFGFRNLINSTNDTVDFWDALLMPEKPRGDRISGRDEGSKHMDLQDDDARSIFILKESLKEIKVLNTWIYKDDAGSTYFHLERISGRDEDLAIVLILPSSMVSNPAIVHPVGVVTVSDRYLLVSKTILTAS
ncbi:3635_t:CDS:2 [Diversispora eburnea]|uniref:3635_t:CDS:1 n=1 Tax=Diversispora eburnea TaxID=1213867 RepID=A0A9N8ZV29_9GLOM|nr:3635_t:CDS:2 [Diversispora eburnea]